MSNPGPKLRIVPYNPKDYSLGEALAKDHGTVSNDPNFISAALSLYFQWPDHRNCLIYPGDISSTLSVSCELDYDRDERTPSEIRVKTINSTPQNPLQVFNKVNFRFEVFRTCYEFQSEIIATDIESENQKVVIITVPTTITVYKTRRLPRIFLDHKNQKIFPETFWISGNNLEKISVLEIGMKSIRASHASPDLNQKGILKIGELEISAEILKTENNKSIFLLRLEDSNRFGKYFDCYSKFAYPGLTNKYNIDFDRGVKLYLDSKYLGKFLTEDHLKERISELKSTWNLLKQGVHSTTADYYTTDAQGELTGASSVTLSFFNGNIPIWVFHQLCALTKPDLLEGTGYLYSWRAEYLAARPEPLGAAVWFDSRSRWLERIYVKFANQSSGGTKLHPVKVLRCNFSKESVDSYEFRQYPIGDSQRIATVEKDFLAGANPKYLNASGILNAIVAVNKHLDMEKISKIANFLTKCSNQELKTIEVTIPQESKSDSISEDTLDDVDRFCTFPKDELVHLLSSVEHSVAITARKLIHE